MPVTPRKIRYFVSRRQNHKKTQQKKLLFGIAVGLIGLLVGGYQVFSYISARSTPQPKTFAQIAQPTPTPYYQNIALLGYGGGNHDGGALTDSIVVAHIDDKAKRISLISIPRDFWIELPLVKGKNPEGQKINAAYALGLDDAWYANKPEEYKADNGGGGNLARYALEKVLGQPVNHFVAVSFQAFVSLVDTLGGITITRSTAFTDPWYPVEGKEKDTCGKSEDDLKAIEATMSGYLKEQEFPCRYETLSFGIGEHTLNGETALKYVRSRHSAIEGGDFYRSQRQRQVLNAIKEKALNVFAIPSLIQVAQDMITYIDTDYSAKDVPTLIELFLKKKDYVIESIALTNENVLKEGVGPNGEYILIPKTGESDFKPIQMYLEDRFSGLSEASASARFNLLLATPTPKVTVSKLSDK